MEDEDALEVMQELVNESLEAEAELEAAVSSQGKETSQKVGVFKPRPVIVKLHSLEDTGGTTPFSSVKTQMYICVFSTILELVTIRHLIELQIHQSIFQVYYGGILHISCEALSNVQMF